MSTLAYQDTKVNTHPAGYSTSESSILAFLNLNLTDKFVLQHSSLSLSLPLSMFSNIWNEIQSKAASFRKELENPVLQNKMN